MLKKEYASILMKETSMEEKAKEVNELLHSSEYNLRERQAVAKDYLKTMTNVLVENTYVYKCGISSILDTETLLEVVKESEDVLLLFEIILNRGLSVRLFKENHFDKLILNCSKFDFSDYRNTMFRAPLTSLLYLKTENDSEREYLAKFFSVDKELFGDLFFEKHLASKNISFYENLKYLRETYKNQGHHVVKMFKFEILNIKNDLWYRTIERNNGRQKRMLCTEFMNMYSVFVELSERGTNKLSLDKVLEKNPLLKEKIESIIYPYMTKISITNEQTYFSGIGTLENVFFKNEREVALLLNDESDLNSALLESLGVSIYKKEKLIFLNDVFEIIENNDLETGVDILMKHRYRTAVLEEIIPKMFLEFGKEGVSHFLKNLIEKGKIRQGSLYYNYFELAEKLPLKEDLELLKIMKDFIVFKLPMVENRYIYCNDSLGLTKEEIEILDMIVLNV